MPPRAPRFGYRLPLDGTDCKERKNRHRRRAALAEETRRVAETRFQWGLLTPRARDDRPKVEIGRATPEVRNQDCHVIRGVFRCKLLDACLFQRTRDWDRYSSEACVLATNRGEFERAGSD